ncbi:tRNA (adenosine(37)-N6)-dimethylallyltransferase MiaA, partial [Campylobacter jejuni]|nr:tRNA (adenosine(37)-N6)-dimethylallyltransferase MiaA [Campylobacter jejuni]
MFCYDFTKIFINFRINIKMFFEIALIGTTASGKTYIA